MSKSIDRAAEVIGRHRWHHTATTHCSCGWRNHLASTAVHRYQHHVAQALADAGLLATPERDVEQRRAGAIEALREAAEYDDEDHATEIALGGDAYVHHWLAARADNIEAQR